MHRYNLTLVETAFRWMIHHSLLEFGDEGSDGVLLGVSSLEQLRTNLEDIRKGALPEEVVAVLDEAWVTITKGTCVNYWR